jgi:tRNA pseudouridine38-40 synthase
VRDRLDVREIARCGGVFEGLHDFRSYADAEEHGGSTRVKVARVEVGEAGDLLLVRVLASHFLWKMVRRMVGVMVEVGRGGLGVSDAVAFLREPSDAPAQLTAPPSGLFLERVLYEGDAPPGPLRPVLNL